jgi:hypothetical protein
MPGNLGCRIALAVAPQADRIAEELRIRDFNAVERRGVIAEVIAVNE